jgi:hypothetical protein
MKKGSLRPKHKQSSGRQARVSLRHGLSHQGSWEESKVRLLAWQSLRCEGGGLSYYITMLCSLEDSVLSDMGILGPQGIWEVLGK